LGFALLHRSLDKETNFLHVPILAWSLILLVAVILVTAKLTGGIGFKALGGSVYGGKRYYTTLAAVVVYFALVSQPIPLKHAKWYAGLFFLTAITAVFSNIAYVLGPSFYMLYAIFPADLAVHQALADYLVGQEAMARISGMSWAGHALFCFMLLHYGARGIFDFGKPWRLILFLGVVAATMLGGFRSFVVLYGLILMVQFHLEKLYRTKIFFVFVAVAALGALVILPNTQKLPLSVQRSLSVLPFIKVSPVAQWNANYSSEWRLAMWKLLVPEIPKYLVKGKGYAIDPTELYLVEQSVRRGLAKTYESALVAGDYHNGPLSVIIPFGLGGAFAFLWFCAASLWVLYANFQNGPPALKTCNSFFLTYFVAKLIFFCTCFGALNSDLVIFTGLVGLNVSLNGGVCRKPVEAKTDAGTLEA
jgi:hypothetical protein